MLAGPWFEDVLLNDICFMVTTAGNLAEGADHEFRDFMPKTLCCQRLVDTRVLVAP